ncbi:hypothetical protein [Acidicapsa acidisoli]|uniref:hypothetical protein n=1 Tax=Acidicapsa acidisoli TaxID=1615681 RepID=UPI0021DF931D|nr:hypothetical protein [Acidicapsa acidisoli]
MIKALALCLLSAVLCPQFIAAQEANSGFDLRATLSGQAAVSSISTETPRSGSSGDAGFRSVFYPTWKINDHWTATGAWQLYSSQYFFGSFSANGYGAKGNLLQATLNYSRISNKGSVLIRAGQLSTAFGSFPLRYDDADNALIDLPIEYGYYSAPVSILGLAGAQIDATRGKWDGRAQFVNSSPVNPRSLFARDQYGNWAGGGGYTIRQGLRVGVSAFRGPYLDRKSKYFFPGEENPSSLPAHALGLDIQWARGHWNVQGELQKFVLPYTAIPTFREQAGYAEVKRVLNPRWYLATRVGYTSANASGKVQSIEATAGFRPDRLQLIKIGYELEHYSEGPYSNENTLAIQIVTSLHRAVARN